MGGATIENTYGSYALRPSVYRVPWAAPSSLAFPSVLQPLANFGTARATGACIFAFDDYIAAVDAWIPPSLFV